MRAAKRPARRRALVSAPKAIDLLYPGLQD